jgi:ribosomal protein S19E (S16A)
MWVIWMPRGKKIKIETEIDDDVVDRFRSLDVNDIRKDREQVEKGLSSSLATVFRAAQDLYKQKAEESEIRDSHKLYSVKDAYDYLRGKGLVLSFRAFGGRIERGTVPFVKVGRKRYIPRAVLDDVMDIKDEFYTVKEAYNEYKKANTRINFRAFIGRVEKGSVPSVKLGTRRLIPRDAIDALTHVSKNYHSVTGALQELHKAGIKIKRNAFERRLDRGRIPHEKVGGRRFIHEKVLKELVGKELALRKQKSGRSSSGPRFA